jgi:hypothetical protein
MLQDKQGNADRVAQVPLLSYATTLRMLLLIM